LRQHIAACPEHPLSGALAECDSLRAQLQAEAAARAMVGESERPAPGADPGRPSACCYDCLRPYGGEHGFPDLVISDAAWRAISPTGDQYGTLCPSCICNRLAEAGIETVGAFTGGPVRLVGADEMTALLKAERSAAEPGRLPDEPPPSLKRSVDKWEDEGGAAAPETGDRTS
jgi:hypothetical protein